MLATAERITGEWPVGATPSISVFEYPACAGTPGLPEWVGWGEADGEGPGAHVHIPAAQPAPAVAEAALRAEFDQKLAEETRRAFESGCERGRGEGRAQEREAQAPALKAADQKRVQLAAQQIESFAQERDRYLRQVEREVVELALAVATRILRREAQMDPLLLTGAVRVALGQLSQTTEVRLKVPPGELEMWTEAMALLPNLAVKPQVLAGEGMRLGDCALETQVGSVDLGIRAQLGEIERGFFDRPGGQAQDQNSVGRAAALAEARK
jgi:flagellar assembly protein FliH